MLRVTNKREAEQGGGLNDYPPSRPVLGRYAPGMGRAVGQSLVTLDVDKKIELEIFNPISKLGVS
jgi:hypothetical protein